MSSIFLIRRHPLISFFPGQGLVNAGMPFVIREPVHLVLAAEALIRFCLVLLNSPDEAMGNICVERLRSMGPDVDKIVALLKSHCSSPAPFFASIFADRWLCYSILCACRTMLF
jgi:hypothetical protein